MPPSQVNDSARALMASTAAFRDDISGAIATAGTSTAYTVTSYQVFDSLAHLHGQMIAFTPHATNSNTVTLNLDGLGAKPLRPSPGVELYAGTLVLGTPYVAVYNNSDSVFYLQNFYNNPYNIPLGSGIEYWGSAVPNSAFVFPVGQQISQSTYASLYALFGANAYGADGGGLFYLPDKRERVSVMKTSSASRLTSSYFGGNSTVLGAVGGSESHTLTTAQLASHTHSGTTATETQTHTHDMSHTTGGQSATHTHSYTDESSRAGTSPGGGAFLNMPNGGGAAGTTGNASADHTHSFSGSTATQSIAHDHAFNTAAAGSGNAHNNTQPTIVCNYILRVL
jgi:microcystin-dependent protein